MALKLPRLPANQQLVDAGGIAVMTFSVWWQSVMRSIEGAINGIQDALKAAGIAQTAANAANAAAATAQAAAVDAQKTGSDAAAAAKAAAAAAAAAAKEAALVNSYITPSSVLTCTTTTISIAAHTRYYTDGTSVAVSAGAVPVSGEPRPYVDYVSYVDAARAGGAVAFAAAIAPPTQGHDVHVVGAITVPATGSATGGSGPRRPGEVDP